MKKITYEKESKHLTPAVLEQLISTKILRVTVHGDFDSIDIEFDDDISTNDEKIIEEHIKKKYGLNKKVM